MKGFVPLLLLCGCVLLTLPENATAQQVRPSNDIAIKLGGLDGKFYDTTTMRGNVLLVSFGATWCKPCVEELRALEDLKREYSSKPVKFFWVDIERPQELPDKRLREFARSLKLSFPVLRDPSKFTYAQFSQMVRVPLVVFIDKQGNLVAPKQFGMAAAGEYKSRVRSRLDSILAMGEVRKRWAGR